MTVHDCPHCECVACSFCDKPLGSGDEGHTIMWGYYSPPPPYSKKRGSVRDKDATACNECAKKLNHLLSMLQGDAELTTSDIADVADHPKLHGGDGA